MSASNLSSNTSIMSLKTTLNILLEGKFKVQSDLSVEMASLYSDLVVYLTELI